MAKRALLIGCNYPGKDGSLDGCVNDVFNMKSLLEEYYEFDDFTILIDTDDDYPMPTGQTIKSSLREIVQKSQPGDILFVHYSGHGTQIPSDDPSEADMMDEALVPTDGNLVFDDDLREILRELPDDVYLTFISDCCHSGGMLDHTEVQISGDKDLRQGNFAKDLIASLFGLDGDELEERDFNNRSLPQGALVDMIRERTEDASDAENVRFMLKEAFGDDASSRVVQYTNMLQAALGTDSWQALSEGLSSLYTFWTGAEDEEEAESKLQQSIAPFKAGHKPQTEEQLSDDVGVLITGCQSNETSADVAVNNDPNSAYGALSYSIQSVVRKNFDEGNPEMTNREVVNVVRNFLAARRYKQNPCLECSDENADRCFITGNAPS